MKSERTASSLANIRRTKDIFEKNHDLQGVDKIGLKCYNSRK